MATGCDRGREPPSSLQQAPAPVASLARILGVDASDLEAPVDPPPPAGDWKAEIAAFTTVQACVEARTRLDPLVGEAIAAIGYDTFLRDACRVLDAAKAGDPARCDGIDASGLRDHCRATVAQAKGAPDLCPWISPTRPRLGREPSCVAVASRDARLCASVADAGKRAACEAIAGGDDAPCRSLGSRSAQAVCRRAADRWRSILTPAAKRERPLVTSGTLHVAAVASSATFDVDLGGDLDVRRGVVVEGTRIDPGLPSVVRFTLGPSEEWDTDFVAPSPHLGARLALAVRATLRGSSIEDVAIERAELVVPGRAPMHVPAARATMTAKLAPMTLARGAPLELAVAGTLSDGSETWRVTATVISFVRDVVATHASGASDRAGVPSRDAPADPLDGGATAP